jgi:DNA-binding PadR family transcriptional regulator
MTSASVASNGRARRAVDQEAPEWSLAQIGILAAVSECGEPVNRYKIVKQLKPLFPETSIYNEIPRMADRGLLSSELVEGRHGPTAGYSCTEQGLAVLRLWAKTPPASLLAPSPEMLLWLSTVRVRKPGEVLRGINLLVDLLREQHLKLELDSLHTRKDWSWGTHQELEYRLEEAGIDASRQFLAVARELYEDLAAERTKHERPKRQ